MDAHHGQHHRLQRKKSQNWEVKKSCCSYVHAACHSRKRKSHKLTKENRKRKDHLATFSPSTWTKKYTKARGTMTTAKMGVLEMITIMVERDTKTVPSNMSTVAGRASSMT